MASGCLPCNYRLYTYRHVYVPRPFGIVCLRSEKNPDTPELGDVEKAPEGGKNKWENLKQEN